MITIEEQISELYNSSTYEEKKKVIKSIKKVVEYMEKDFKENEEFYKND